MHPKVIWFFAPLALTACLESLESANLQPAELTKPPFMVDEPDQLTVDGIHDDLVSAGLSLNDLRAPLNLKPDNAGSLRQYAIHQNFNALLALKDQDGYGRLYATHMRTGGLIAGTEYRLPVRYSDHAIAAVLMLQVPVNFDAQSPCLVATASSGSRGIYGAAGVVGAWALHQGCALVTTDKGTGTGFHLLSENLGYRWTGESASINADNLRDVHFSATNSAQLSQFRADNPHRIATRHAHSRRVPEKDWGRFVLQAIQFGFYQLNQHHRPDGNPDFSFLRNNTTVLAAAISNGGAAVLAAAEQDDAGWIDGVVVSEPNVFLPPGIQYRNGSSSKTVNSLLSTAARTALLAPCAALAQDLPSPLATYQLPVFQHHFAQRCLDLKQQGLVEGDTLAEQAQHALQQLLSDGISDTALPLLTTSSAIHLWEAILVNYANNFGRHSVEENLCGFSYAYTDSKGSPAPLPPEQQRRLFGNSGIPPVDGISIVDQRSQKALAFSVNADMKPDLAFDGMRCLAAQTQSPAIKQVESEIAHTGALRSLPTVIVQGGADNLIQPVHHARAYAVLNRRAEGDKSQLHYVEVKQGQHFDAFLNLPPLRTYFVPLHAYFEQSMDAMMAHLRNGQPLPASQLIDAAPAASPTSPLASLPPIAFNAETILASPNHRALEITGSGIAEK